MNVQSVVNDSVILWPFERTSGRCPNMFGQNMFHALCLSVRCENQGRCVVHATRTISRCRLTWKTVSHRIRGGGAPGDESPLRRLKSILSAFVTHCVDVISLLFEIFRFSVSTDVVREIKNTHLVRVRTNAISISRRLCTAIIKFV